MMDMPRETHFEPIKAKKIEEMLKQIFDQPQEDSNIYLTCIDMVRTLKLKDLVAYLFKFIVDENAEWSLQEAAWKACEEMNVPLPSGWYGIIYTQARMKQQLSEVENLLRVSDKLDQMKELNRERCSLLKQISYPENISLLLPRRFNLGIHKDVEEIIDSVLKSGEESSDVPNEIWEILKAGSPDDATLDKWVSLIREGDGLIAASAGHRLIKMEKQGKKLPIQKLKELLDLKLTADRLLIVAELISTFGDENLSELLEQFLHGLIPKTKTPEDFEALARLALVLKELNFQRGNHLIAYVIMFFFHDNKGIPEGRYPLLLLNEQFYLPEEDYKILINQSDEYARAAIFKLETFGAANLLLAERGIVIQLDKTTREKMLALAEKEDSLKWRFFFAVAGAKVCAFELLPYLIKVVNTTSKWNDGTIDYYYHSYEKISESWLGMIIRTIGYLARLLYDNNRAEEAKPAMDFLRELYHNLSKDTDRRIVIGLSTALGFLGEWEPILKNLGHGEPWIHESARNILKNWLSLSERINAALWIIQYLKDCPGLPGEVRSTLQQLKKDVEDEIGIYIHPENKKVNEIKKIVEKMDEIRNLFKNKSISALSEKVLEILSEPLKVSEKIYLELNEYLSELIPDFPKAILKYDTRNCGEIIEKIWRFAENKGLEKKFGTNIFRWYDHYGHYSKAREVLQKLIKIAIKNKDRRSEALHTNNLGFEYMLEEKWEEGASLFKKAADIFSEEKDEFQYWNARANYLICQIEKDNIDDIESMEKEIELIKKNLTKVGDFRTRKPYILLAKLEQRKGNIEKAISFVEEAISSAKNSQTTYTEEDKEYLNKLKKWDTNHNLEEYARNGR